VPKVRAKGEVGEVGERAGESGLRSNEMETAVEKEARS